MYEDHCVNDICQPKCKIHNDCPKGDICREGHCTTNSCKTKEDCPSKPPKHAFCRKDLCHYIDIGCFSDKHCPEGKKWTVRIKETCIK